MGGDEINGGFSLLSSKHMLSLTLTGLQSPWTWCEDGS